MRCALGGSARPREVKSRVLERVELSEAERSRTLKKTGLNAVENEIAWARNNLRMLGLIDPSVAGVWRLTPKGEATHLTTESARPLSSALVPLPRKRDSRKSDDALGATPSEGAVSEDVAFGSQTGLLETIQSLPPSGFERLCQRLLREAGFIEVHVTGQTGDGGIDGHGILQINELVSFRVLFQCKRYQGSVGPSTIRDFRGAMTGRTDKGIFLTTGSFSRDAEKEAVRDGAPPVELVDGVRLVELMERLNLGVKPRTVYDVDERFFEEYRG